MMVSFDTNILVYATLSAPLAKTHRARDLLVCGMRTGSCILLLQTLAEFSSVAIRKAGNKGRRSPKTIDAWRAVLPVQGTEDDDLSAALCGEKSPAGVLGCDVMGRSTAGRRSPSASSIQDGFELAGVRFVNPFEAANNRLIDEVLPAA
jgi:predicted nucleic acid-binding protein